MQARTGPVVVITGASSGVGRATARAFAGQGATTVLVARSPEALSETQKECEALGGRALALPSDVTDSRAMCEVAATTVDRFGRLDVWINNAGVGAVGRFEEVPIDAHRRTVETNLIGPMNGAHAALPHFIRQQAGHLITNVSIGGFVPTPYAASYAASKFGARAFSNSLRQEMHSCPEIHVSAIYPYFLDTPGVIHGANYTGKRLQPSPPVYAPEKVAWAMVDLVKRPQREVVIGMVTQLAKLEYKLAPRLVEWSLGRFIEIYLDYAEPAPISRGNLDTPMPETASVHGGLRGPRPGRRAGAVMALAAAGAVAGCAFVLARRRPARALSS